MPQFLAFLGGKCLLCGLFVAFLSREIVELDHAKLTESSGICASANGEMVWSHNDSGDSARLFAFDRQGRFKAEALLNGVAAVDWEDICAFSQDGVRYLAVGDVGDNQRNREHVQIYIIKEPSVEELDKKKVEVEAVCSLTVTYPDGPIDCEALAYDPRKRVFVLPCKETFRCRLYEVDATILSVDQQVEASLSQTLIIPLVTGADISSDGEHMVFSTYAAGAYVRRDGSQNWGLTKTAQTMMFELPMRRQGESICFADKDQHLLLTSEFSPTPLFEIDRPSFK